MQDNGNVSHQVVVYFVGWHLGEEGRPYGGEVAGIPWEKVSYVNHAFWCVEPEEGGSSFDRRSSGQGARTSFRIAPVHPETDLDAAGESAIVPGLSKRNFDQYAYFSQRYPQVHILISVGGWCRSGFFSEMAYTPEGRCSFISSCMALMEAHPWIGGFDIDWEYPAGSRSGERLPDPGDPDDEGCPIFGTPSQDRENFTLFLQEFRETMDAAYGYGVKKLTACASGSVDWTLPCQDWAAAAPSLDLINIMSYDLAGIYDGITGHASSALLSKRGAAYMQLQGIPMRKLCIGSPLYGTPFRLKCITPMPLGSPCEAFKPIASELCTQSQLMAWISEAVSGYEIKRENGAYVRGERFERLGSGWRQCYDARSGGAYLYNDDETSSCYQWFISYEDPLSLQMKLDTIREQGIGGIIVWELSQDTPDYRMIGQMHDALLPET